MSRLNGAKKKVFHLKTFSKFLWKIISRSSSVRGNARNLFISSSGRHMGKSVPKKNLFVPSSRMISTAVFPSRNISDDEVSNHTFSRPLYPCTCSHSLYPPKCAPITVRPSNFLATFCNLSGLLYLYRLSPVWKRTGRRPSAAR